MRTRPAAAAVAAAFMMLLSLPQPAAAWGGEAHRFIMARAIPLLPRELRPFFEASRTALVEHTVDPDLWRTVGWNDEPPRHFLDMDAYGPPPFSALPRDYEAAIQQHGRDFVHGNGLLPWRAAEIYAQLVEAFAQKGPYSRSNVRLFASVLSHYVADAHVPFHAVLNHDGQLTGQWGIHSRFESELFERYRPVLRVQPRPITAVGQPRDFMFETLLASFSLAATILEADRAAALGRDAYDEDYFRALFSKVRPILEQRLAGATTATASLITAAWIEAGRLPLPVRESRPVRPIRRQ